MGALSAASVSGCTQEVDIQGAASETSTGGTDVNKGATSEVPTASAAQSSSGAGNAGESAGSSVVEPDSGGTTQGDSEKNEPGGPTTSEDQSSVTTDSSETLTTSSSELGPSSTSENTTADEETVACQDGETRSCNEREDGSKIDFPGGMPQGSCKSGVSTCKNGNWGSCVGAIAPAAKDTCEASNDDNCNGVPTDHCDCKAGETKVCGSSQGECKQGQVTCGPDGKWGQECVGEVKPSLELCDGRGRDEDCNGLADLGDPKCECLNGRTRVCSVPGRQGDCGLGSQRCVGGQFESICRPRFRVAREQCGSRSDSFGRATGDEDCDGRVDESDVVTVEPQGCSFYFEDKDRDGFGGTGNNIAVSQSGATFGCLCPATLKPSGWTRGPRNKANVDCGDCVNGGDLVRPGAGAHTTPSACLRELNRSDLFDYNCDGRGRTDRPAGYTCSWNGSACVGKGYWDSGSPACGEREVYYEPGDCFGGSEEACQIKMIQRFDEVACH